MAVILSSPLIFLFLLIIYCNTEGDTNRRRRQIVDGTNRNVGVPQQKPSGPIPLNNIPSNNPNQANNNNHLLAASQSQVEPFRSRGFYDSPLFQPRPFSGEKPAGWFGTNQVNWVSNRESELDKNKLASQKSAPANNFQPNIVQTPRTDGGPFFLERIARQYASKGEKAFKFGQFETTQGRGSVCSNHENFDGYIFGRFPCPLPPSTGMNQLDQFCCGPANYQHCCNAQEFSQNQRGAYADHRSFDEQRFPKRTNYSSSTKKILYIISPIAGFIVLSGIIILVFLYYKKFRKEQNRTGKPAGSIRLQDDYAVVPQQAPIERTISNEYEQ